MTNLRFREKNYFSLVRFDEKSYTRLCSLVFNLFKKIDLAQNVLSIQVDFF